MMDSEITNLKESKISSLNKVTPLSKYLALGLFVSLPFIGGWIGYTYAPEKMVEVERIVEVEKVVIKEVIKEIDKEEDLKLVSPNVFEYSSLIAGSKYGGMIAEKIVSSNEYKIEVEFSGNVVLAGTLTAPTGNPEDGGMGPNYSISQLTDSSIAKLPRADGDDRTVWFGIDNYSSIVNEAGLKNRDLVEVTINKYNYIFMAADVWNTARVVSIRKIEQ
jgi:hypothetical protein